MIEKFQESLVKKDEPQPVNDREMPDATDQVGNSPILDGMNTRQGGEANV